MVKIHHINCGTLLVPGYPTVVCHCLLLAEQGQLALVDTGIGLLDVQDPIARLGQPLIEAAGFQFREHDTALRRIEALGFDRQQVRHIVLTHGDPDHAGGLADFPMASVHVADEEWQNILSDQPRYVPQQFAHAPQVQTYATTTRDWFGLEARAVPLGFSSEVLLVPLFGHTRGHCGVATQQGERWLLHVGDAYYLQAELTVEEHPVSALAAARADDDRWRRQSLAELRRLLRDYHDRIEMCGYHDLSELAGGVS